MSYLVSRLQSLTESTKPLTETDRELLRQCAMLLDEQEKKLEDYRGREAMSIMLASMEEE